MYWAMNDDAQKAKKDAMAILGSSKAIAESRVAVRSAMIAKTREINRQLGKEIPWFRCSDKKFEDIYYYLWALYLMYYIDVQAGLGDGASHANGRQ